MRATAGRHIHEELLEGLIQHGSAPTQEDLGRVETSTVRHTEHVQLLISRSWQVIGHCLPSVGGIGDQPTARTGPAQLDPGMHCPFHGLIAAAEASESPPVRRPGAVCPCHASNMACIECPQTGSRRGSLQGAPRAPGHPASWRRRGQSGRSLVGPSRATKFRPKLRGGATLLWKENPLHDTSSGAGQRLFWVSAWCEEGQFRCLYL